MLTLSSIKSLVHSTLELATRMKDTAQSVSEWHRRMTSQKLNQKGVSVDLDKFPIGSSAYFYKPPNQGDVITSKRKAKHLDHYVGPGVIESRIGDKSFVISYQGREYQRDAGMILPEKDHHDKVSQREQEWRYEPFPDTGLHVRGTAPVESEYVILKDEVGAPDWYCAQILQVLPDRVKVAWLTTKVAPLADYESKSTEQKVARLKASGASGGVLLRGSFKLKDPA